MNAYKAVLLTGMALSGLRFGEAQAAFMVGPLTVDPNLTSLPAVSGTLFSVDLSGFSPVVSSGTHLLPGGSTLVLSGISSGDAGVAGIVQGSTYKYAAPVTNSSGSKYAGNYLSSGIGSITIDFPSLENVFGLLWGSVDAYNTLSFDTLGGPVSFSGLLMPASGGSQGFGGSFYTTIISAVPFTSVTLSSTNYAFEAATFEYGVSISSSGGGSDIPEPASIAALGAGLLGLGLARRRKDPESDSF